jgi:hypothetical protein
MLKGAKWVNTNPVAAARLSVEKKYILSSPELNAIALSHLHYLPSVSGAEFAVKSASQEMKKAGMLGPQTDVNELAKRAFVHLDGVSDEWIESASGGASRRRAAPRRFRYPQVCRGHSGAEQSQLLHRQNRARSVSRLQCCIAAPDLASNPEMYPAEEPY